MPKVLVTGGQGFIGTNFSKEHRSRTHETWRCDILHSDDLQFIRTDVGEYRRMQEAVELEDFDYVYHAAAEYRR